VLERRAGPDVHVQAVDREAERGRAADRERELRVPDAVLRALAAGRHAPVVARAEARVDAQGDGRARSHARQLVEHERRAGV
jgi:hypothetical protein